MNDARRIQLDWTKLFAFEQVEAREEGRLGHKLAGKVGEKDKWSLEERGGARLGGKIGEKAP